MKSHLAYLATYVALTQANSLHSLIWHNSNEKFQNLPSKYSYIKESLSIQRGDDGEEDKSKNKIKNRNERFYTSRLVANLMDEFKIVCPSYDDFNLKSSNSKNINPKFNPQPQTQIKIQNLLPFDIYLVDKTGFDSCDPFKSAYQDRIGSCNNFQNSEEAFYGHVQSKIFDHEILDFRQGEAAYFVSSYQGALSSNLNLGPSLAPSHPSQNGSPCMRFIIYVNKESEQPTTKNEFKIFTNSELLAIENSLSSENGAKFTNFFNPNDVSSYFNNLDENTQLWLAMGFGAVLVIICMICCGLCYKVYQVFLDKTGRGGGNNGGLGTRPSSAFSFFSRRNNRSTINYSETGHGNHINVSGIHGHHSFYKGGPPPGTGAIGTVGQTTALLNANSYHHPVLASTSSYNTNRGSSGALLQQEYSYHPAGVGNQPTFTAPGAPATPIPEQGPMPDSRVEMAGPQGQTQAQMPLDKSVSNNSNPTYFQTIIQEQNSGALYQANNQGTLVPVNFQTVNLQTLRSPIPHNLVQTVQMGTMQAQAQNQNSMQIHQNNNNNTNLKQTPRPRSSTEATLNHLTESNSTSRIDEANSSRSAESNDISMKNPSKDSACGSNMTNSSNDGHSTGSSGGDEIKKVGLDERDLCAPGTVIEV